MGRTRSLFSRRPSGKGRLLSWGGRPFLLGVSFSILLGGGAVFSGCGREGGPGRDRADPRVEGLRLLAFLRTSEEGGKGFFLDRFEVTQGQFAAYLASAGRPVPPGLREAWRGRRRPPLEQEDWPVSRVSPRDALAYARWRGMRLPRLEEWEWAVGIRGAKKESFPWGEEFDRAHWDELKCNTAELGLGRPANVGTFELGATRGSWIYDLVGNVAEWVRLPVSFGPGRPVRPEERDGAVLFRRFLLEEGVRACGPWAPSWWRGLLPSLAPLGEREWGILRRPWAWVGWSYASRMERSGHSIPGRLSGPKAWAEWVTTVGFRCAAYPEEILEWLAGREGPSLEGATGRAVARFLRRFREIFGPMLESGRIAGADGRRTARLAGFLGG